uniref:Uncharacterized protein n=1 Tax=Trichuris muris TaxID=70415 RepID=A0A5S6QRN2_TRIMR
MNYVEVAAKFCYVQQEFFCDRMVEGSRMPQFQRILPHTFVQRCFKLKTVSKFSRRSNAVRCFSDGVCQLLLHQVYQEFSAQFSVKLESLLTLRSV